MYTVIGIPKDLYDFWIRMITLNISEFHFTPQVLFYLRILLSPFRQVFKSGDRLYPNLKIGRR